MRSEDEMGTHETENLMGNVLRLDTKVLGLVLGLLFGLVFFMATNWLVIKGGDPVGPHLQLLSQYFMGYSVSFGGSLVGFGYGSLLGGLTGLLLGWIYNWIAFFKSSRRI